MRVEILCTGDEILTGKTINTNYSHMAQRLGDVGLTVHWGTTVGDDRESLLQAFRQAGERADAVIVNGGLGPTLAAPTPERRAGAACGFAVTIGKARFFFPPGVPREMRLMIDEQVIPRLLKIGGITGVTRIFK